MPDLDQLFVAMGAHAETIPTGTVTSVRRRGQQRRNRVAAACAALAVLAAGATVGAVQLARDVTIPPAHQPPTPKPTVTFVPLRPVGFVPMELAPSETGGVNSQLVRIRDGVAYFGAYNYGTAAAGSGIPLVVTAMDLATGDQVFAPVDLGGWHEASMYVVREALVVVAAWPGEGGNGRRVMVLDPASGTPRWQQPLTDIVDDGYLEDGVLPYDDALVIHSDGVLRGLDLATGAELWRADAADVIRVTRAEPAGLTGDWLVNDEYSPDPADPRLVVVAPDGNASVVDASTGETLRSLPGDLGPGPFDAIGDTLLVRGGAGRVLSGVALDGESGPTQLYQARPGETIQSVIPCGPGRVCLKLRTTQSPDPSVPRLLVVLDPTSGTELARLDPGRFGTQSVVEDRVLTGNGGLLDLNGEEVGTQHSHTRALWLTAGSMLTMDFPNSGQGLQLGGVSTLDGSVDELGHLPCYYGRWFVGDGYLACAARDGFHAWQFATG